jgi:hypothetical protein
MSITNHVVQGHEGPQGEKLQKQVASYDKATPVSPESLGCQRDPVNGEPTGRLGRRDLAREALVANWRGCMEGLGRNTTWAGLHS